jgi:RNA polymerase sigma-70 factor, ECF subfamily
VTDSSVYHSGSEFSTSSSLLVRLRASEAAAWDRLVELYTGLVYRWCRRAGLQPSDAADVGQEVFRAVARKVGEFRHDRPGDTFRGWLRAITRNKIRDHARHRPRERTGIRLGWAVVGWRRRADHAAPELPEPSPTDDAAEARHVLHRALRLVERDFEPGTWRAFWRVVVDGARPADVADELGVSVNAVYLAKGRVLHRLREEFSGLLDDDLLGPGRGP